MALTNLVGQIVVKDNNRSNKEYLALRYSGFAYHVISAYPGNAVLAKVLNLNKPFTPSGQLDLRPYMGDIRNVETVTPPFMDDWVSINHIINDLQKSIKGLQRYNFDHSQGYYGDFYEENPKQRQLRLGRFALTLGRGNDDGWNT